MAFYPKQSGTTEQSFAIGAGHNKYSFTLDASTLTASRIWTLPNSNGYSGQVLSTDGSGNLSWITTGGASADVTVPYYLPPTESYTVAINKQALFGEDILVEGDLEVDGHLIDTRSPLFSFMTANPTGLSLGPANAAGDLSIVYGYGTTAAGIGSITIGTSATGAGDQSIVIGASATGNQAESITLGSGAITDGLNALAIGTTASALAANSIAFGSNSVAQYDDSTAVGAGSSTSAALSVVLAPYQSSSQISGTVTTGTFSQFISGINDINFAKTVNGTLHTQTTTATSKKMACANVNGVLQHLNVYQTHTSYFFVVQFQATDGIDWLAGTDRFVAYFNSAGVLTYIAGTGVSLDVQTSGAYSWVFQSGVVGSGEITFTVTGQAGKNISWSGSFTINQVTFA